MDFIALFSQCGFDLFVRVIEAAMTIDGSHVFALNLLEWWWDTTNSFHFPWGEMTITPHDFSMITGLRFTQSLVECDSSITPQHSLAVQLLGPVCASLGGKELVSTAALRKGLTLPGSTSAQKVRILILELISLCLAPDKTCESRTHLRYLASLEELSKVRDLDWGGLGYAALIRAMRSACRQQKDTSPLGIASFWRVLEVWVITRFLVDLHVFRCSRVSSCFFCSSWHLSTSRGLPRGVRGTGASPPVRHGNATSGGPGGTPWTRGGASSGRCALIG